MRPCHPAGAASTLRGRVPRLLFAAALLLPAASGSAQYGPVDPVEAATRQLASAVRHQPGREHRALLNALRQLRDPALRPLLQSLVQRPDWEIQLEGILGLAELGDGRIDPFLLTQIRDPTQQVMAVRACLAMRMVGVVEAGELLKSPHLDAAEEALLIAERMRLGGAPDLDRLRPLADHRSASVAGLASMLLAQAGESAAFERFTTRLDRLDENERTAVAIDLARAAERHLIAAARPLLERLATDRSSDRNLAIAAVSAILAVDPRAGIDVWAELFDVETAAATRIRLAVLLLSSGITVAPEVFDRFAGSGEVLEALGRAGRARAVGSGEQDALAEIVRGGHRLSVTWAVTALGDLPPKEAAPIYESLIRDLIEGRGDPRTVPLAIEATSRLVGIDPPRVASLLEEASRGASGSILEALLVGLLASEATAEASEIARGLLSKGTRRADSMAILCIARHADRLSAPQLAALGVAAAGGGGLDPSLQTQASWLYLKHSGQVESAMSAIFASP
jgi:hypothetical protein